MSHEVPLYLSVYVSKQNYHYWDPVNLQEVYEKSLGFERVAVWCAMSLNFFVSPYFLRQK